MAWIAEFPDLDEARDQARKAMNLPLGMTSPLWLAFGAATTAGVAWWWMTRWTRAVNAEAMAEATPRQGRGSPEAFVEKESEVATKAVEAAASVLEAGTVIAPEPEALTETILEVRPGARRLMISSHAGGDRPEACRRLGRARDHHLCQACGLDR